MREALAIGLWVALVYAVLAGGCIVCDRRPHRGGWINLSGLLSYLATFPASRLAERLGRRIDHRRNDHMLLAVLGTASLVVFATALVVLPFVA